MKNLVKKLSQWVFNNEIKTLVIITVFSCLLSYLPFYSDLSVVGRYLDGPNYIEVAKTFYYKITDNNAAYLPRWYYAVHLICYPFFIRLLNYPFVPFFGKLSYLYSMLLSTIIFTVLAVLMFYKFIKEFKLVKNPFWMSVVFIFFPPRWVIYHSVGATESMFIFWCLLSVYFFKKEKYFLSYIIGALATITRIFGVLLFPTYILLLILKTYDFKPFLKKARNIREGFISFLKSLPWLLILGTLIIPFSLFVHFLVYKMVFNMFFAYWQWNAGQLGLPPFNALVDFGKYWKVGMAELYVIYMSFSIYGLVKLYKHREIFWFCFIQFLPITLNKMNDIPRFLTIVSMFVFVVAFERFFDNKYFKLIFPIYLVLVYLYVWNAIPTNLIAPEVWINLIGDQV